MIAKKLAGSSRTKAKRKVVAKKGAERVAKKRAGYNPHTGKPTGRAKDALKRRDALIAKYMAKGLSAAKARQRVTAEMRNNPRKDWRAG